MLSNRIVQPGTPSPIRLPHVSSQSHLRHQNLPPQHRQFRKNLFGYSEKELVTCPSDEISAFVDSKLTGRTQPRWPTEQRSCRSLEVKQEIGWNKGFRMDQKVRYKEMICSFYVFKPIVCLLNRKLKFIHSIQLFKKSSTALIQLSEYYFWVFLLFKCIKMKKNCRQRKRWLTDRNLE